MKVKISIVLKSFEAPFIYNEKEKRSSTATGSLRLKGGKAEGRKPLDIEPAPKSKRSDDEPAAKFTEASIRLPLKQSLYTVLRSPHIDKKSREQFEMKIHKQLIRISTETKQLGSKLFHLKFHEMSGVQMKVIFHYKTRLSSLI